MIDTLDVITKSEMNLKVSVICGCYIFFSVVAAEGRLLMLVRGLFEWNFARKAEFHLLAAFFVGPGKNLWCNTSPVFSGNFLIASFSQETPCRKVQVSHYEKWKK